MSGPRVEGRRSADPATCRSQPPRPAARALAPCLGARGAGAALKPAALTSCGNPGVGVGVGAAKTLWEGGESARASGKGWGGGGGEEMQESPPPLLFPPGGGELPLANQLVPGVGGGAAGWGGGRRGLGTGAFSRLGLCSGSGVGGRLGGSHSGGGGGGGGQQWWSWEKLRGGRWKLRGLAGCAERRLR